MLGALYSVFVEVRADVIVTSTVSVDAAIDEVSTKTKKKYGANNVVPGTAAVLVIVTPGSVVVLYSN